MASEPRQEIRPQPGPQLQFLRSSADLVVYGGAAGGGKTWALLLDALRYAALQPVRDFGAVIFRRTSPQVTHQGGLWDESRKIYSLAGGRPNKTMLSWEWPQHNTRVRFAHLQFEENVADWQGAQVPYIGFDELTHFGEYQFFYMLSRNRSVCGVRPRMRATTNPDADSWVKRFLAPWVDDQYGWPALSGEVRYCYREADTLIWLRPGATAPRHIQPDDLKSCTFIAASIYDNPKLLEADPGYLANLKALPLVERQRLLHGDWNVRPSGNVFKREWFKVIDRAPAGLEQVVRYWDLAGTEPTPGHNDPDYTCGVKLGRRNGVYYVLDVQLDRLSPKGVRALITQTAALDGVGVQVWIEQEPGSSGKTVADEYRTALDGYDIRAVRATGSKELRAAPFSAQAEGCNVQLVRGPWNDAYLNQLTAFPNARVHDDAVDASSGAYSQIVGARPIAGAVRSTPGERAAYEQAQRHVDAARGLQG